MKWLNPKTKRWIAVGALVILSAVNITTPINLRDMIPANVLEYLSWISYAGIAAAWFVFNKETE